MMDVVSQTTQLAYGLDSFYLLVSGVFAMWMMAGFSMFESGLVRTRSVAEILTKNIGLCSIASIMYMVVGYNIMYGESGSTWMPSFTLWLGGDHSVAEVGSADAAMHSRLAAFFFQSMFVATSVSVISGAVAERMKLWPFLAFAAVMAGVIYPIQGFWGWGNGFLQQQGFIDFAGSGMVHLAGASAALAGVLLLGSRRGKYSRREDGLIQIRAIPGSNMPLAVLGTFILWIGWFGFNGGSVLKVSGVVEVNVLSLVLVNTNMAATGGGLAALILARLWFGKTDLTMGLNGILAGLVAITAEPLTPTPGLATVIGIIGGVLVFFCIIMVDRFFHLDDPVGALSVHGAAGVWGLLAVNFSNTESSIAAQMLGIGVIFVWSFGCSLAVWWILKLTVGIRLSELEEHQGADISEIGLEAYPEFIQK